MSNWDYQPFWEELINKTKNTLSSQEFDVWIKNISYLSSSEGCIITEVPSSFYRDQIDSRYRATLEKELYKISGHPLSIEFKINKNLKINDEDNSSQEEISEKEEKIETDSSKTTKTYSSQTNDINDFSSSHLQPEYSFERFVQSDSNMMAYNAAFAIANNPGKLYNPCLIYGGVGLGKTHLMQAIGNKIQLDTNLNVVYVTAEDFTNEFLNNLKNKTVQEFKNKYRNKTDALLIDDIHFFSGKPAVQEELFYTFEALTKKKKAIIFTCDRTLEQLKDVAERLHSRFGCGLQVDLQPPVYETRYAILLKKLEEKQTEIDKEIIDLIAKNIATNVRDLESALIKIVAYKELTNKNVTIETAKELLKDNFGSPKQENISIDLIMKVIAEHYNLSSSEIRGKKRNKNIVLPRQLCMYITREITDFSTTEIGNEFGGRDHTTVMHACQKIEELLRTDPSMDSTIQLLIKEIKNKKIKM